MRDKVRTSLKRWRDNRYVSAVLAEATFPVHKLCSATAHQIESHITKNGVAIKLPNGKKMKLGSGTSTGLSSIFFWHGIDGFEPKTSQSLRFLFERSTTFIDVGANVGCYSVLGALWNPGLEVVAFEPVPQIFDKLVSNVHLNGVKQQVRCENAALSSKSGVATFLLPPSENSDLETTGTLVEDGWQAKKNSTRLQVTTLRFDDYAERFSKKVDVVKIDVEDFEADVLEGMRATILKDRPFIICEILPRAHHNVKTLSIVQSLGYQPYWITPDGYIRVQDFAFSRRHTDFLLSPVSTPEVVVSDLDRLWAEAKGTTKKSKVS